MIQRYSDNIKKQKPQNSQLGILQIFAFFQKNQQTALVPGESAAGVT